MNLEKIPFNDFDVDNVLGRAIMESLAEIIESRPESALDIQKISNNSHATPLDVKKVLYYLFYKGLIKAKYIAYHKKCGHAVSRAESSVYEIILEDYLDDLCAHCPDPISDTSELEVRMYFWGKNSI